MTELGALTQALQVAESHVANAQRALATAMRRRDDLARAEAEAVTASEAAEAALRAAERTLDGVAPYGATLERVEALRATLRANARAGARHRSQRSLCEAEVTAARERLAESLARRDALAGRVERERAAAQRRRASRDEP